MRVGGLGLGGGGLGLGGLGLGLGLGGGEGVVRGGLGGSLVFDRVSCRTRAGFNGYTIKTNQDSFFMDKLFMGSEKKAFFGVFDGHGSQGHKVSAYLKRAIPEQILVKIEERTKTDQNYMDHASDLEIETLLTNLFMETNKQMNFRLQRSTELSGSTGITVLYQNDKFYCASVGDSEARILTMVTDKNYVLKMVSNPHLPSDPLEEKRILEYGGRIQPFKLPDGGFIGPPRIWRPEQDIPGLMMSRTFGDRVGHSCGITDVPEVMVEKRNPDQKCLILGSDGVFEILSKETIVGVLVAHLKHKNSELAAEELVEKATAKWREQSNYRDDITVVVAYMNCNIPKIII
jgi:serine/threonine protein phosphatase PrpC